MKIFIIYKTKWKKFFNGMSIIYTISHQLWRWCLDDIKRILKKGETLFHDIALGQNGQLFDSELRSRILLEKFR